MRLRGTTPLTLTAVTLLATLAGAGNAGAAAPPGRLLEISVTPDGRSGSGAPDSCSSSLSCSATVDVSADGRFIAFSSAFNDLVPGDENGRRDVFVRDLTTDTTELVSVATDGSPADADSATPSISADGRFVAFLSEATTLADDDGDGIDAFVRDRATGTTVVASVSPSGDAADSRGVHEVSISDDGRYVAFISGGFGDDTTNHPALPYGGINFGNVYVRDLAQGETRLVSLTSEGGQSTSVGISGDQAEISGDGSCVAFTTRRHDIVPGDTNGNSDVFVRDLSAGTTERVSVSSEGTGGNWASYNPAVSADCRFVAFASASSNLVPTDTNGSRVPVAGVLGGTSFDVFVHDRATRTTERVSVSSSAREGNDAYWVAISGDGRFVAFDSAHSGYVPGYDSFLRRIYVHDRVTGQTDVESTWDDGRSFEQTAFAVPPALTHDGRYLAFVGPGPTSPFDDATYLRDRGPRIGVGSLEAARAGGVVQVAGTARFGGAVVSAAAGVEEGSDAARALGAELKGARIVHRPEEDDLLGILDLTQIPGVGTEVAGTNYLGPPLPAGAPGVEYGLGFTIGERRLEARALRTDPQRSGAAPGFALFDCTSACVALADVSGGIGTTGNSVRIAIPRALLGGSVVLSEVQAFARAGADGTTLSLPDAPIDPERLEIAVVAPSAMPGEADWTPTQAAGRFQATVPAPDGPLLVWARACVSAVCGLESVLLD